MHIKYKEDKLINHNEIQIVFHPNNKSNVHSLVKAMKKKLDEIEVFDDYYNYYSIPILFIYYIEIINYKVFVYTKDKTYRINKNIKKLKNELKEYSFFQISASTLVNGNHVKYYRVEKDSRRIIELSNNESLIVNRHYKDELKENVSQDKKKI